MQCKSCLRQCDDGEDRLAHMLECKLQQDDVLSSVVGDCTHAAVRIPAYSNYLKNGRRMRESFNNHAASSSTVHPQRCYVLSKRASLSVCHLLSLTPRRRHLRSGTRLHCQFTPTSLASRKCGACTQWFALLTRQNPSSRPLLICCFDEFGVCLCVCVCVLCVVCCVLCVVLCGTHVEDPGRIIHPIIHC